MNFYTGEFFYASGNKKAPIKGAFYMSELVAATACFTAITIWACAVVATLAAIGFALFAAASATSAIFTGAINTGTFWVATAS